MKSEAPRAAHKLLAALGGFTNLPLIALFATILIGDTSESGASELFCSQTSSLVFCVPFLVESVLSLGSQSGQFGYALAATGGVTSYCVQVWTVGEPSVSQVMPPETVPHVHCGLS